MAGRWPEIEQLYHEALERAPHDRAAFLRERCAGDDALRTEVESLLANEPALDGFLEGSALNNAARDLAFEPAVPSTLPRIPGYRILKTLGEGGMGVVYLAEQIEPIRRKVALKLIRQGMDTRQVVARFQAERQALALMHHPYIAAVYDAGTTPDGRPYFVMEYVEGVSITDYCDRHQLSMRGRLELFLKACGAVQHAHQKGVIHRDLKPSNILISEEDGEPVPKVIDFGIAKAIDSSAIARTAFTDLGMMIGTPDYMSPEQAALSPDIDTATDVYSLGVVFYELLAGDLPFDPKVLRAAGYDEMRRIIREDDPTKPSARLTGSGEASFATAAARKTDVSRLAKLLRGDLDLIALKALEKDRRRRYQSIATFAADIGRYLADEPIAARPRSVAYRMRKFTQRYRAAVVGVVAVFLALVAGLIVALVLYASTERLLRETERLKILADQQVIVAERSARDADDQRAAALSANNQANDALLLAGRETESATSARRDADYGAYVATIGWADGELRQGEAGAARSRLLDVATELRGWEWQHLFFKTDTSLAALASAFPCERSGEKTLHPLTNSDNVLAFSGSRIYLRRCATLEAWAGSDYVRSAFRMPGKVLAVGPYGTAVTSEPSEGGGSWIVRLVDPATDRRLNLLGPFPTEPMCASVSRDGDRLAVGIRPEYSPSGEPLQDYFHVYDLRGNRHLFPLIAPKLPALDTRNLESTSCMVAFTPDGTRLATSGSQVHLWKLEKLDSKEPIYSDPTFAGTVAQPIAWNAGGTRLAIGRLTGLVDILNVTASPEVQRLDGNGFVHVLPMPDVYRSIWVAEREKGQVRTVAFSPNDAFVVSGTDVAVGVWDVEHGKLTEVRSGHTSPVIGIAFDQAGHIFSADTGGHIRVWPGSGGMTRVPGSVSAAEDLVQSADGSIVGVSQTDGGVSVWRLTDLRETVVRPGSRQLTAANKVRSLAITPDARHLLVGETDAEATVRIWNLQSNTSTDMETLPTLVENSCAPLVRTDPPSFDVSKMATSPDGRTVAYGQGRCVIVRDLLTMETLQILHERPLKLMFRPDGSLLVISREDQIATGATKVLIWNWRKNTIRSQRAIPLLDDFVDTAMSANGRAVAFLVNPTANLVSIWDGDLQGEISRLPVPAGTQRVALSSGGDRLASAGRDNAVRIWDVAHHQLLLILPDDDQHSGGIAFTADGRLIAARSSGGLTIWETKPRDFSRAR